MTNCQVCGAKSGLFLCNKHIRELSEMLTALVTGGTNTVRVQQGTVAGGGTWYVEYDHPMPGLLEHLADAAVGLVRMGDGGRRSPGHEGAPMKGNNRAGTLLRATRSGLLLWSQRCATLTGTRHTPLDPSDIAATAMWLAGNAEKLAGSDQVGTLYADMKETIAAIERAINRPVPPRFCGPCPAQLDAGHRAGCGQRHPHACSTALMAPREAVEVMCPSCKTTHHVDTLIHRLLADVDHWRFDRREIELIMDTLDEHLSPRTFRHWRSTGRIRPSGFRAADGRRITVSRKADDDVELFRLSDVRKVRAESARKVNA